MKIRFGCSGWSYKSWIGGFYKAGTREADFLKLYSKVYDMVEIDSTFYGIPEPGSVRKWHDSTPDSFSFFPKMPRIITHEKSLINSENELENFLFSIGQLKEKLGYILIQLPPKFSFSKGFDSLRSFLKILPETNRFAVEFRDNSWYREEVYSLLKNLNVVLAWADRRGSNTQCIVTSKDIYLRLIGDRLLPEDRFGTILRDKSMNIRRWIEELAISKDMVENAYVFANNHYQGFGPGTINLFRELMGMNRLIMPAELSADSKGQKTLF